MDQDTLFYIALFVFWALSQLAALRKKQSSRKPARPAPSKRPATPARAPAPSSWERQGVGTLESLRKLESRFADGSGIPDERVRAQLQYEMETGLRDEVTGARDALASAVEQKDPVGIYRNLQSAQQVAAHLDRLLNTAGVLSSARRRPEMKGPLQVADRLQEEVLAPLHSLAAIAGGTRGRGTLPPTSAVILDPDDETRASSLARMTLFVPRSVTVDPLHWALTAQEIARILANLSPGLYREIFDSLELSVSDAELDRDPEALPRLLFGSFLARILGDATGACLFGPPYLRALTKLYQEPGASARITTIYLNQDGTVYPEPPAHLRIFWTAAWLRQMGFAPEANEALGSWTEAHGEPPVFSFYRTMGTVPAETLFGVSQKLMTALYLLELSGLGARPLHSLPGLSDTARLARETSSAREAFSRGEPSSGPVRALLAAAILAALESPSSVQTIRAALYDSVVSGGVAIRERLGEPGRVSTGRAPLAPSPRALAEALILGEILLEPRRR